MKTASRDSSIRVMGREFEAETVRFRIDSGEALNVRLPKDSDLYMKPAKTISTYYAGIVAVWIAIGFAAAFVLGRFDSWWMLLISFALMLLVTAIGRQFVIAAAAEIESVSFSPQNFEAVARRAHEGKHNRVKRVDLEDLGAR